MIIISLRVNSAESRVLVCTHTHAESSVCAYVPAASQHIINECTTIAVHVC